MKSLAALFRRSIRTFAILLLVAFGTIVLVRSAPGYLSDAREMDGRYASAARVDLMAEATRSRSLFRLFSTEVRAWTRGSFGRSRQYEIPVFELIKPRLAVTGGLLTRAIVLAWTMALCGAILSSSVRSSTFFWQIPATLLLALPTAALVTFSLLAGTGGPVLVMAVLLAARDFKFLDRIMRKAWHDPHLLQARGQGIRTARLLQAHILPSVFPRMLGVATLSIVTALSTLVPVEVIFSVPGLGQLAWSAAMNRDLPVLLAVTMIMAFAVTFAGMVSDAPATWQSA